MGDNTGSKVKALDGLKMLLTKRKSSEPSVAGTPVQPAKKTETKQTPGNQALRVQLSYSEEGNDSSSDVSQEPTEATQKEKKRKEGNKVQRRKKKKREIPNTGVSDTAGPVPMLPISAISNIVRQTVDSLLPSIVCAVRDTIEELLGDQIARVEPVFDFIVGGPVFLIDWSQ